MNNFTYSIPTTVFFGEGSIKKLPKEILKCADNVLIVYGGGSIKNNGIYMCCLNNIMYSVERIFFGSRNVFFIKQQSKIGAYEG